MRTETTSAGENRPVRIDTARLKRRHSIADVAAWYGLELRPVGRVPASRATASRKPTPSRRATRSIASPWAPHRPEKQ